MRASRFLTLYQNGTRMKRVMARIAASAAVVGVLAGAVIIGAPAPKAEAAVFPNWDAIGYMLTIKGSQLQSTMGDAAIGAWSQQSARLAATSASQFAAQSVYGNIGTADLAEVVPIHEPRDTWTGTGKKRIRVGQYGRGFNLPVFSAKNLRKAVGGVGGATVAATGYMFRGDIAVGVGNVLNFTGLTSTDTTATVCSDSVFGGANFLNFLTGQDCEAWRLTQEYIEASTISGGVHGGWTCGPGVGSGNVGTEFCVALLGATYTDVSGNERVRFYFDMTRDGVGWREARPGFSMPAPSAWLEYQNPGDSTWVPVHSGSGVGGLSSTQLFSPVAPWLDAEFWLINNYNSAYVPDRVAAYRIVSGEAEGAAVTDLLTDPDRFYECVVTTSGGPILRQNSATWRNSDESPGVEPSCAELPEGEIPTRVQIYEWAGDESWLIWDETPDQSALDFMTEHEECLVETSCFLDLVRIADGLSCFGLGAECDGWMTSPTRDVDYQCEYGGTVVALSECYAYAPTFNEQKRMAGNAYADPVTGEEIIGGGTSRSIENAVMGRPLGDPQVNRDCWGRTGWGELNPLEWVVMGGQCVLEWAFVPRPQVLAYQQYQVEQEWEGTGAGKLAVAVANWHLAPTASGCAIPVTIPMPFMGEHSFNVLDACPGSWFAPLAEITRVVVNISFVALVVMLLRRYMGGAVDFK